MYALWLFPAANFGEFLFLGNSVNKVVAYLYLLRAVPGAPTYGFKVALVVDPQGVVSTFGLAEAASDERPIGDALLACDRHQLYLADKGFTAVE